VNNPVLVVVVRVLKVCVEIPVVVNDVVVSDIEVEVEVVVYDIVDVIGVEVNVVVTVSMPEGVTYKMLEAKSP
jgi:hypothetical protein